ncbi:MAG TPA: lysophospholipid acyltransferase family protein [Chitinophagaceae bacterium]|nr:lysophospholipid acyltransferase family protein [Chitinophagaceae bacterium]
MYYIVFGFLYLISLLPFWILYRISDFCYIILYYVVGYRRDVVAKNLLTAFPEKTGKERKGIAKRFYRNFTDNWIESIKLLSISEKALDKRVTYDYSAVMEFYQQGRSCQMHLGHLFNWEIANVNVAQKIPYRNLTVYTPISSRIVDRLFKYIRTRFGTALLASNNMGKDMLPYRNTQYCIALVADQNSPKPLKCYWLNFFGVPTGFMQGPEKGARYSNIPMAYVEFSKPRRGHYHIQSYVLSDNPAAAREGELTEKYVRLLEASIRKCPDLYLWTHKRWKHEWKEEYRKLWIDSKVKI